MRQNPSLGLVFLYTCRQGLAQRVPSQHVGMQTSLMVKSIFLLSQFKYFPAKLYLGTVKLFFFFPTFCNTPKIHLYSTQSHCLNCERTVRLISCTIPPTNALQYQYVLPDRRILPEQLKIFSIQVASQYPFLFL